VKGASVYESQTKPDSNLAAVCGAAASGHQRSVIRVGGTLFGWTLQPACECLKGIFDAVGIAPETNYKADLRL
jgi:hypothetical protein